MLSKMKRDQSASAFGTLHASPSMLSIVSRSPSIVIKDKASRVLLTDKHCPLAGLTSNMLVNKHVATLDRINTSAVESFGTGWLSKHKRKLGELTNEGKLKQTNDHH